MNYFFVYKEVKKLLNYKVLDPSGLTVNLNYMCETERLCLNL